MVLSKIFAPLQETEHPDLLSEYPGFFVTEIDRVGNLSTNNIEHCSIQ